MDDWTGTSRLIVTNGDSAAGMFREFGFGGSLLPWRDVLHDGPVPDLPLQELSEIRAGFVHQAGWAPLDEVRQQFRDRDRRLEDSQGFQEIILWFEHDLYDQLQLLQVIHLLAGRIPGGRISAIFANPHITTFDRESTLAQFEARQPLTIEQAELGSQLWTAFTRGDYRRLEQIAHSTDCPLPDLPTALFRWLEEFPWTTHGLTRTEYQALERVNWHLRLDPLDLFVECQKLEETPFLGDSSFFGYLEDLVGRRILRVEENEQFLPPWKLPAGLDFRSQSLVVDIWGFGVLESSWLIPGSKTAVPPKAHSARSWRGGLLIGPDNPWQWDPETKRLVR